MPTAVKPMVQPMICVYDRILESTIEDPFSRIASLFEPFLLEASDCFQELLLETIMKHLRRASVLLVEEMLTRRVFLYCL